jgi:hypothetical protein
MIKKKLLLEAYRKVGNYAPDVHIPPGDLDFHERLLDEYQRLDALEEFQHAGSIWLPAESSVNSAKKAALEAAVAIGASCIQAEREFLLRATGEKATVLDLAEDFYKWLIKKDDHDADGNQKSPL